MIINDERNMKTQMQKSALLAALFFIFAGSVGGALFQCYGKRQIYLKQCGGDCSGGCEYRQPPAGTACDTCYDTIVPTGCTLGTSFSVMATRTFVPHCLALTFGESTLSCLCDDQRGTITGAPLLLTCFTCTGSPCLVEQWEYPL